jgi:hypothetical protein
MTAESRRTLTLVGTIAAFATVEAAARGLNLNSSRQDDTDERLYDQFEQPTEVAINLGAGKADELAVAVLGANRTGAQVLRDRAG